MFALRNIMQHQIISKFLFLTGFKVYDIAIVCYVTFNYFTSDVIDCLLFRYSIVSSSVQCTFSL